MTIKLELTEREVDHLLLALESSITTLDNVNAEMLERGLPHAGTASAFDRFYALHGKIAGLLDE